MPLLSEIIIGEKCFTEIRCDLELCDFPNLEKIIVKKESLGYLNSLVINNNRRLKTIEFGKDRK